MTKTLKVIDPFLRLDCGDVFEQNENGDYTAQVREDFTNNEAGRTFTTKYHADFTISKDYAEQMVKDGFLEEVREKKDFVNIFDEIELLINKYNNELNELNSKVGSSMHPAVKREKEVVLTNILTVLDHLKNLKK